MYKIKEDDDVARFPYISGQTALISAFAQLRKGFPGKVDAGYLQRFNIAPANESYVISVLKFLGLIDEEGNRVEDKTDYFYGNDDSFKSGLDNALRSAYSQLFDEMGGDGALSAEKSELTHWFRASDKTSDLVGQRQASTFLTLAALAGHGGVSTGRNTAKKTAAAGSGGATKKTAAATRTAPKKQAAPPAKEEGGGEARGGDKGQNGQDVGLTVRIEVNLPPGGDSDTYDSIFASIKKHLMS